MTGLNSAENNIYDSGFRYFNTEKTKENGKIFQKEIYHPKWREFFVIPLAQNSERDPELKEGKEKS
jgi:hypothetical protein